MNVVKAKIKNFILKTESGIDHTLLINQGIEGLLDHGSEAYRNQYFKNCLILKEYQNIKNEFNEEDCLLLKGPALLQLNVYEDFGDRSIGDMDLLVNSLEGASNILNRIGYFPVLSNHWEANNNKLVFSKNISGLEMVVEIHKTLFYHCEQKVLSMMVGNVQTLSYNHFIVHLVGHLGFMHTFLKIHWLLDIYLFIKKYREKIDLEFVENEMKRLGFINSWRYTMYYIEIIFQEELYSYKKLSSFEKYFLDSKFILYPEDRKINYYAVKHLVKERMYDSLHYDLQWLIGRGWKT